MKNLNFFKSALLLFLLMIFTIPFPNLSKEVMAGETEMSVTIHESPSLTINGETFFPSHSEVQQFEASTGGTFDFNNPDGSSVTITFFSGTTEVTLDFFIDAYEQSAIIASRPLPTGKNVVGSLIYDMRTFVGSVRTATFDAPFAMTVHYLEEQIGNLNEETLDVYFWDESQGIWTTFLASSLDTEQNTVTILTDHLTLFAVFGEVEEETTPVVISGGEVAVYRAIMLRGDFRVVINNNDKITYSRSVILSFDVDPKVKKMMISNTENFSGANQEAYKATSTWTLTEGGGVKTVYVKFYDILGVASEVVTDIIIFKLLSEAQKADIDRSGKTDILDFDILMAYWGETSIGNPADLNNDNIVDIFDFNLLMVHWT